MRLTTTTRLDAEAAPTAIAGVVNAVVFILFQSRLARVWQNLSRSTFIAFFVFRSMCRSSPSSYLCGIVSSTGYNILRYGLLIVLEQLGILLALVRQNLLLDDLESLASLQEASATDVAATNWKLTRRSYERGFLG